MNAQHTPTPYMVVSGDQIRATNGTFIADADWQGEPALGVANAVYIVRACNSHDELVAALRQIEAVAHNGRNEGGSDRPDEIRHARIALARAKDIARAALAKADAP